MVGCAICCPPHRWSRHPVACAIGRAACRVCCWWATCPPRTVSCAACWVHHRWANPSPALSVTPPVAHACLTPPAGCTIGCTTHHPCCRLHHTVALLVTLTCCAVGHATLLCHWSRYLLCCWSRYLLCCWLRCLLLHLLCALLVAPLIAHAVARATCCAIGCATCCSTCHMRGLSRHL